MTIQIKKFEKAKNAITFLEDLTLNSQDTTIVFRGHTNETYRLDNSWQRHSSILHESGNTLIDGALEKYNAGLTKLGINSLNDTDRLEVMEHARHHGIPTPCLDFSYSPYVALFFAFNGVRKPKDKTAYSVVYALDITQLADAWAKDKIYNTETEHKDLMSPSQETFKNEFPANILHFIRFPSRINKRMQHQLGCLLYDTLDYGARQLKDLEGYIDQQKEPDVTYPDGTTAPGDPILTKVLIDQNAVKDVFSRLELMNITGGNLYNSADGVVLDVKNSYVYTPKFSYLRDVNKKA